MNPTRKTDESFYRLFSVSHTVSEHLTKREDSELRDKYDHNAFCYSGQPTEDELRAALAYQKERGDTFLKLEGYEPLADAFGMECEETLTMVLPPGNRHPQLENEPGRLDQGPGRRPAGTARAEILRAVVRR